MKVEHRTTRMASIADAASMMNCSIASIYRRVAEGKLPPPIQFGKYRRWPLSVLEDWLAQHYETATA